MWATHVVGVSSLTGEMPGTAVLLVETVLFGLKSIGWSLSVQNQRIRIRLKAFDHRLIDVSTKADGGSSEGADSIADAQRALHYFGVASR